MKTLLFFNLPDKPNEMGSTHIFTNLETFLDERSDIIKDPTILEDRVTFVKGYDEDDNAILGYALIFDVPNDFQN